MLAVALVVAGCQTAPVQEMSDARQAITVAKEAGAEEHAASQLNAAVKYLQSAQEYLNHRKYTMAKRDAISAKNSAIEALRRTESETGVEKH